MLVMMRLNQQMITKNVSFGHAIYNNAGNNTEMALIKFSEIFNHSDIKTTGKYLGLRHEEWMEAYDWLSF